MKVFVIPDTHFPFHNKAALKEVLRLIKKERPTHVVQIGDLLDQYSFSRYAKSRDVATPGEEMKQGIAAANDMWKAIRRAVPRAKCLQLLGNHDIRFQKRLMEQLPEAESLFDLGRLYKFDGVMSVKSDREFLIMDGVVYCHGWLSKSLDHARFFNRPVVHGHRHRPAVETSGKLWSMDVGFLGDEKQLPFNYTMSKMTNWTIACGIVEDGKPRLVLL